MVPSRGPCALRSSRQASRVDGPDAVDAWPTHYRRGLIDAHRVATADVKAPARPRRHNSSPPSPDGHQKATPRPPPPKPKPPPPKPPLPKPIPIPGGAIIICCCCCCCTT